MSAYVKPDEALLLACTTDIHREFAQIRSMISLEEIHRLADNLLCQQSPEWPLALVELQTGKSLKRLLNQLNLQVKTHGFSNKQPLTFEGPFPTFSLRSSLPAVNEYRSTLRAIRCVEFLGNKAWKYPLKSVAKSIFPFQIKVATLALGSLGCSTKQQQKIALLDLAERIKGCILNFLYEWENLLTRQTGQQLLTLRQNAYLSITEAVV